MVLKFVKSVACAWEKVVDWIVSFLIDINFVWLQLHRRNLIRAAGEVRGRLGRATTAPVLVVAVAQHGPASEAERWRRDRYRLSYLTPCCHVSHLQTPPFHCDVLSPPMHQHLLFETYPLNQMLIAWPTTNAATGTGLVKQTLWRKLLVSSLLK